MAWTDVLESAISNGAEAFSEYNASQNMPITPFYPTPYGTVAGMPGYVSPYGTRSSSGTMILLLVILAGVFFFAFGRSK